MLDSSLVSLDIPELRTAILFRRRPVAIPADLRPGWRIGLLVLLLRNCCRAGRTSFARLHVLSWSFRTTESRRQLQAAVEGRILPDSLIVRFEPFLNQAVDFAIGDSLVRRVGGDKIELTAAGTKLAEELQQIRSAFAIEKEFMKEIGQKVTETFVNKLFGGKNQL